MSVSTIFRNGPLRFTVWAVFIILAAALARLADLSTGWIVAVIFIAWALVALLERSAHKATAAADDADDHDAGPAPVQRAPRKGGRLRLRGTGDGPAAPQEPELPAPRRADVEAAPAAPRPATPAPPAAAAPAPAQQPPSDPDVWLDDEPDDTPVAPPAPAPRAAAPAAPAPVERDPVVEPAPAAAASPVPEPVTLPVADPPVSAPVPAASAYSPAEYVEPAPVAAPPPPPAPAYAPPAEPAYAPEAASQPVPEPEPVPAAPVAADVPLADDPNASLPLLPPPAPVRPPMRSDRGTWNLWELEGIVRAAAGRDPAGDEERSLILMYLREFANPEGLLGREFDDLVRDTFGDLLPPR